MWLRQHERGARRSVQNISELREVQNWLRNAVEAASKKGIPTGNLVTMRWVLTRQSEGRFKARVVVQGFTDLHLAHLRRESPTASRRARNVFFGLAVSAHMHVHKGDVTAAFLQGSDTLLVLTKPVQELAETLKLQPWECVRLRKAVYRLVNTPRAWWAKVNQVVALSAGSLLLRNLVFGGS